MTNKFNQFNYINAFNIPESTKSNSIKIVSLFSGCGGMDLGFLGGFNFLGEEYKKNPYEIIFANDIFKQANDVYEANFNHKPDSRSIVDLTLKEDLPNTSADVVLGGFPCQTFSYSGKRGGLGDPRGQLYLQMIRVIKHYKPKVFVAENVDGIRNSKKGTCGTTIKVSALDKIIEDFKEVGYNVQYQVLTAADFGVPQMRKRVFIIGLREDLGSTKDIYFPEKVYDQTGEETGKKWLSSKDGIDDLWDKVNDPTVANHTIKDISKAKFYPGRKMQGNTRIPENRPSITIRAEHHGNIEAHYRTTLNDENDMNGWRRLSVRECARLQSFPDSFNFTTSASAAYKMIGNAVAPVVGWHISRAVYYTLYKLKAL